MPSQKNAKDQKALCACGKPARRGWATCQPCHDKAIRDYIKTVNKTDV